MSAPVLAARALSKSFGPNEVLKGIEFEVHSGRAVALCGENGAGKSTLIKLLTGLYHPTSGHIEFDGKREDWPNPRASLEAGIAVVHQEFSTLGALSVAENIFLNAEPLTRFGLGSLTSSGFPGESAGLLTHYNDWRQISQATLGYGYGVSVTALQMAAAYGHFLRPPQRLNWDHAAAIQRDVTYRDGKQVLH